MNRFYWMLAIGQISVLAFIYLFSGECNHIESTARLINVFTVFWAIAVGILAKFRIARLRLGIDDSISSKRSLWKLTVAAPLLFLVVCTAMTHDRGGIGCPF